MIIYVSFLFYLFIFFYAVHQGYKDIKQTPTDWYVYKMAVHTNNDIELSQWLKSAVRQKW